MISGVEEIRHPEMSTSQQDIPDPNLRGGFCIDFATVTLERWFTLRKSGL
jgi:hypothetical protein